VLAKLAFASLLAAAGLPVPPAGEVAERSEPVLELIAEASRAPDGRVETAAGRIDAAVRRAAAAWGERSVEYTQAETEAGLALIRDWQRYDLALPHIDRAQSASRAVFGRLHRETAYAVQDLAVVRNELRPELFLQWSKPLAVESLAIRRKVLGPEHLETAGSERFLADWIYGSWSRQRQRSARSPMLPEARGLARHALGVMEDAYGATHHEVVGTRQLLAEIALAMQDFALAEELGLQLVIRYGLPCSQAGAEGRTALALVASAVRAQARLEEADGLDAAAARCGTADD
jgi:hypothetical protein